MKEETKLGIGAIGVLVLAVIFGMLVVSLAANIIRFGKNETAVWKAGRRAECVQMLSMARSASDTLTIYAARSDCARVED